MIGRLIANAMMPKQVHLYAEPERLQHTVVPLCPEIKTAYRLKALAEADQRRVNKHHKPGDNRHGRNSGIAEWSGRKV